MRNTRQAERSGTLAELRYRGPRQLGCAILAFGLMSTLAHAAPERLLHRFLETAISPDGVFIASAEGDAPPSGREPLTRDLVIRRTDGSSAITVNLPCGRVPECWPASLAWRPAGSRLTFALRVPGGHARSIYAVDADGSHLTRLLQFDGTIADLRYGHDGKLAMLATERATKEVGSTQVGAAIVGDLSGPVHEQRIAILNDGRLVWASPPDLYVYEYDWLPDGKGFVGTAAPGDGDNNWWVAKLYAFDAKLAARVIYTPTNSRQQIGNPRVSPDGREVAFIGGLMSDFVSIGGDVYLVPLPGGGSAVDATAKLHASATSLSFDCGGQLIVKLLEADSTKLVAIPTESAAFAPRVLWQGSGALSGRESGLTFGCPAAITATVRDSFVTPPEIHVGPIGAWHPLTDLNAGLSMPTQAQSIRWESDHFNIQGWLLTPVGHREKMPMITVVHGGPASAILPFFAGPGLMQILLQQGYALFFPNPRGSFGQGEDFTQANVRDLGHGDLRDILRGIDAAEHAAPIDDSRLGIMGGSYGGFMTMWAVTQTTRFKSAVAVAGISNWLSYYGENGIDRWLIPYFGASVYEDPAVYARSSPINFIRNARTPTLVYVGANDISCPPPQSQEFWHGLHDLGTETSLVIYPNEGHGLRDPENLADSQRRVLAWFDLHLKAPK